MKILSLLPGTDIVKVGSASKELQRLSCNNDLWKKKFDEEFEILMNKRRRLIRWKGEFAAHHMSRALRSKRKAAEKAEATARWFPHVDIPGENCMARYSNPLAMPYSNPLAMPWLFG